MFGQLGIDLVRDCIKLYNVLYNKVIMYALSQSVLPMNFKIINVN